MILLCVAQTLEILGKPGCLSVDGDTEMIETYSFLHGTDSGDFGEAKPPQSRWRDGNDQARTAGSGQYVEYALQAEQGLGEMCRETGFRPTGSLAYS